MEAEGRFRDDILDAPLLHKQVEERGLGEERQLVGHVSVAEVGIDQQHFVAHLRQAEGQVRRRVCFAHAALVRDNREGTAPRLRTVELPRIRHDGGLELPDGLLALRLFLVVPRYPIDDVAASGEHRLDLHVGGERELFHRHEVERVVHDHHEYGVRELDRQAHVLLGDIERDEIDCGLLDSRLGQTDERAVQLPSEGLGDLRLGGISPCDQYLAHKLTGLALLPERGVELLRCDHLRFG